MIRRSSQRWWGRRVAVMVIWAAALAVEPLLVAYADPFEAPPLVNPATDLHLQWKLVWFDLETTDLAVAKRFYHALFAWEFRDYHASGVDYTLALANGTPVAGLVRRQIANDTERRSAWLPFFSVSDVNATFAQAVAAHAQVRSEPENLPLRGRQARLTDPEGAPFALVNSSSGDPSDDPNPRPFGTWGVPMLLARDPGDEAVFYQKLFSFAMLGQPTDQGFERIQLSAGNYDRANVRPLPSGDASFTPQWVGFVRVFSTAATALQAVKLGGHILVATSPAAHGATITILSDPTGATFGILELPPASVSLMPVDTR